jgi:hypothetical protein
LGSTPPKDCFEHPAEVHTPLAMFHELLPRLSSGKAEADYDQQIESARRQIMERYETAPKALNDG